MATSKKDQMETSEKRTAHSSSRPKLIKSSSSTSSKLPHLNLSDSRKKLLKNIVLWVLVFFVTLVVIDYGVQYLNYRASVAIVNGERIYRKEYLDELENTYGTVIASQMIDERLFQQESERQNITITEANIDAKVTEFEDQYGGSEGLQTALESSNLDIEQLRERIKTNLIIEQILSKDIEITDEERQTYYDQNYTGEDAKPFEEVTAEIEDALMSQKIQEAYTPWITDLRASATIKDNIAEPKDYSFLGITREFISQTLGK